MQRVMLQCWSCFLASTQLSVYCTGQVCKLYGKVNCYWVKGEFGSAIFWRYPRRDVTDSIHILMLVGRGIDTIILSFLHNKMMHHALFVLSILPALLYGTSTNTSTRWNGE